MKHIIEALRQKLNAEDILLNEPMNAHTTFLTGGQAAVFLTPRTPGEISRAISVCREEGVRFGVIGRGSNILFPDGGLNAVVISTIKMDRISLSSENTVRVYAEAGALLKNISDFSYKNSLSGFEFACGIPGTLGGALRMNAGAYGGDIGGVFYSAEVLDENGDIKTLYKDEMDFSYRHSRISGGKLVVLSAELTLSPGNPIGIKSTMDKNIAARNAKQPLNLPSAGSAFKRPSDGVSAAGLIDGCGLKGHSVGGARVSEKHCGFIVNTGGATSEDVRTLINRIQRIVYEKHGILLEPEIIIID